MAFRETLASGKRADNVDSCRVGGVQSITDDHYLRNRVRRCTAEEIVGRTPFSPLICPFWKNLMPES